MKIRKIEWDTLDEKKKIIYIKPQTQKSHFINQNYSKTNSYKHKLMIILE